MTSELRQYLRREVDRRRRERLSKDPHSERGVFDHSFLKMDHEPGQWPPSPSHAGDIVPTRVVTENKYVWTEDHTPMRRTTKWWADFMHDTHAWD